MRPTDFELFHPSSFHLHPLLSPRPPALWPLEAHPARHCVRPTCFYCLLDDGRYFSSIHCVRLSVDQARNAQQTHRIGLRYTGYFSGHPGEHTHTTARPWRWRGVLAQDPNDARAHHNLGVALAQQGQSEAAVESLRLPLVHHPRYAEAHFNLGNVLLQQWAIRSGSTK
jgi:tetratricopeptide (TPR) repeat protein